MTDSFNATTRNQSSGILPPWIWFWLVFYFVGFSTTFDRVKTNLLILAPGSDSTVLNYNYFERVPYVIQLFFDLALIFGVVIIFLPWIRTIFLERSFRLTLPLHLPSQTLRITLDVLEEIGIFMRAYAPEFAVKYSIYELQDYAFVYPIGYREVGIAISSRLLALWRKDQRIAEAILLHEIAHNRHGDVLIVGAGSLLKGVAKYWFFITIVFSSLLLALALIIEHVTVFREEMALSSNLQSIILFHIQQVFVMDIPFILLMFLQSFFWAAALFSLIIMGIWCTEFNADRFVTDTTGSSNALMQVMALRSNYLSRWGWFLAGVAHPPGGVRRWLASQSAGTLRLTILLLLFPIAWFIRFLFLLGWASCNLLLLLYSGESLSSALNTLPSATSAFLQALAPTWIAVAILLFCWPFLTRYWERLFSRIGGRSENRHYKAYIWSTVFVTCVCIIGFVLALAPSSSANTRATQGRPTSIASPSSGHYYTGLKQAYQGIVINTTDNYSMSAAASLSPMRQDQQGNISGYMTIQSPLTGSGPFTGIVHRDGSIQFTVVPADNSGYTAISFAGFIRSDGSMDGTYTLPGITQGGKWQMRPV